ncbi:K02A2.6-like [Cordylochernes scorpioides]|uniref:K02A2.6-like n=1 Tax=Cordylochernes scorpioides TaxID=51811 RepID=A0ABY6K880_9ARAC|nr:K02A2.6-like [Cordylochernes scorpioides]
MASEQNLLATLTQMIQGLREEREKEKLLSEKRRVLKEEEKEEEKLLKEKRRVLKEEEKEEEKLLKEKIRVLKEKEEEKLLKEKEKEEEKLLREKEEERLLRQQEREEFHQKVTNLEIRFQSEIGDVQVALENNIGEVRTECKRLEIELARMRSLEGAATIRSNDSQQWLGRNRKVTNLIVVLRGPALDLLQAVPRADQQSYAMLMGELELRYGEQYLRQGFEADVNRLCHLAYPGAPIDFLDKWAAQTFIDGIRDVEVQRVLRLASFDKSREALVRALEVEAAYRVSESGHPRVRGAELIMEQSTTGGGGKSNAIKEILKRLERLKETGRPGRRSAGPCFRCGRHGHLKRQCTVRLPDQKQPGKLNSGNVMDRPGRKHSNADALSNRPCGDCNHCERIDEHEWDSLSIDNGLLKRIWESADGKSKTMQLVVPKVQVTNVLREIHDGVSGAHFGINKTLKKVVQKMRQVCRKQRTKTRSRGMMREYNMGAPFERIAIDVAGPFPVTEGGNRYILVAMNYFTKWPEPYAIPNQEATTVAKVLMDNLIFRFGVPLELHSDQGRNFEAGMFQELCRLLGIRKTRTTPLHPQSDGMVERFNKTMEEHLSKVVEQHQKDWDTPAKIMFGRELRLPCDLEFGSPEKPPAEVADYVNNLRSLLLETHELVRAKIHKASHRMKTRYDQRANHDGFRQNDLRSSKSKAKVVHLRRLACYQGDRTNWTCSGRSGLRGSVSSPGAAFCRYSRHCHHRHAAAALLVSLSCPSTSGKAERYCQRKGVPLERWFSRRLWVACREEQREPEQVIHEGGSGVVAKNR